jgi:threonylcarbamoyladenosine tRNA methylthiotransferase MtaB
MAIDVFTFGCRLNAFESEVIRSEASRAGLDDVVVVNTCAVTGEAVRQARQQIRKFRRERPQARIVVTGCAAQIQPGLFAAMPEVDRVLGNAEKLKGEFWEATRERLALRPPQDPDVAAKSDVADIMTAQDGAPPFIGGYEGRARAFVQVQNGCDHRCTFCVIPFGRGPSRSVPIETVIEQTRRLVDAGFAEIVLTGVDLTSYGDSVSHAPRLGGLVRQMLDQVPDIRRLRISSIDAVEADRDLLDAIGNDARVMPHLHLSLQAGDDMILKRMKRRHTRADAIAFCDRLRRLRPDIALGADLIAGFPTETNEMFARSLDLVEECGLTFLHVFPYSPRPGTPAARMPQVPREAIKERARLLRDKGAAALRRRLAAEVGQSRQVLMENPAAGRTEHFIAVKTSGPAGAILPLTIAGHDGDKLIAG